MFVDSANLPKSGTDGPVSWGEAWSRLAAGTDETQRIIDNFNADQRVLDDVYEERIKRIEEITGERLDNPIRTAPLPRPRAFGMGRNSMQFLAPEGDATETVAEFDRRANALLVKFPKLVDVLSETAQDAASRRMRAAQEEATKSGQAPELGFLGRLTAQIAGGLMGTARDPLQWQLAAVGGGAGTAKTVAGRIGQTMMTEFAVNAGTEAILQAASQERKRAAGLEHGLKDALVNMGIAGTFGALFGGTVQGGAEVARILSTRRAAARSAVVNPAVLPADGPDLAGMPDADAAARATRLIEGRPLPGDVEAFAADAGMTLGADVRADLARSFEERVLDDVIWPEDATPDDVSLIGAAWRHAQDPDNFPEPEIVARAIQERSEAGGRTLSAEEYERLYDGDEDMVEAVRARAIGSEDPRGVSLEDTFDPVQGQSIRPARAVEPYSDDAVEVARAAAGDPTTVPTADTMPDPVPAAPDAVAGDGATMRRRGKRNAGTASAGDAVAGLEAQPQTLFDAIPIEDANGNVAMMSLGDALALADEPEFHADLLEACKL